MCVFLVIFSVGNISSAQKKGRVYAPRIINKTKSVKKPKSVKKVKSVKTRRIIPPPKVVPAISPELCRSRKAVIQNEERRLEEQRATLAGVVSEIGELEARLRELQRKRSLLNDQIKRSNESVALKKKVYKGDCAQQENCSQYEGWVAELEKRAQPVEESLGRIQKEIATSRSEVSTLRRKIEPAKTEYQRHKCQNLVAGQTSQATIDRCSALFSDWNRLQGDLNRHNNRLTTLKRQYSQLETQLKNTESKASVYEKYLSANCKRSKKIKTVRRYSTVRDRAARLAAELDKLTAEVTTLRKLQITAH